MVQGIILFVFIGVLSFMIIARIKRSFPWFDESFVKKMFFYHFFLFIVYYLYVSFNPSDSIAYYEKVATNYRGETWGDFYGTSTIFIEFLGYPFIKFLGFTYTSMMVAFAFLGFIGFIFFYLFFRENLRFEHGSRWFTLIFFLPNIHFWATSFGKGAIIFLGLSLFFFGLNNIKTRIWAILLGGLITYHVRPHVMLLVLLSTSVSFIFSSKGVSMAWRVMFLLISGVATFFIYKDVLLLVNIEEEVLLSQGLDLSHRASELSKATSGVDISQYNMAMQVFTFLFRPLFFDAPGMLGIIVSFENVFYLYISLKIFTMSGFRFLWKSNFIVKSALLSFITVSIALAQIAGNLGLAIRQKSQVMILFMFVILVFMDNQKYKQWLQYKMRSKKQVPATDKKTITATL